jgi:hypothetical protein
MKVRPLVSLKVTGNNMPKLAAQALVLLQTRMGQIKACGSQSEEANVPVRDDSKERLHLGRRMEKGILESPQPVGIYLKVEIFLIWLLTLDSIQIMEVYLLVGFATQEDF